MTEKHTGVRVVVVEPNREPYVTVIQPDGQGSYLSALQGLVGGPIGAFDPLFGEEPLLYVNEEGLLNGSFPNRAVYASREMEEDGYLSQVDHRSVVREGELYTILFGTFVAVGYGEDGELRDVTDEEIGRVEEEFGGDLSIKSGIEEVLKIAIMSPKLASRDQGRSLSDEAARARGASASLADSADRGGDRAPVEREGDLGWR